MSDWGLFHSSFCEPVRASNTVSARAGLLSWIMARQDRRLPRRGPSCHADDCHKSKMIPVKSFRSCPKTKCTDKQQSGKETKPGAKALSLLAPSIALWVHQFPFEYQHLPNSGQRLRLRAVAMAVTALFQRFAARTDHHQALSTVRLFHSPLPPAA